MIKILKMGKYLGLVLILCFGMIACGQEEVSILTEEKVVEVKPRTVFILNDYFGEDKDVENKVNAIFNSMTDRQKVAQLLMPAIGDHGQEKKTIDGLVKDSLIGGLLMLNGTKTQFTEWIKEYEEKNASMNNLPFLYSADAEPSLVNRKIIGSTPVIKANKMTSEKEVVQYADTISKDLNEIGINYNFAPVVDMAPNKTVGWRSFGHYPDSVISWSNAFIQESQRQNVIATAKHFPGHGFVTGDTHKNLVYIDGEMRELKNYPTLIDNGVLSVMIAHIAIKNNKQFDTNDEPSSISKKIVTDLLRDSLGFEGLIVTDAMNMGGVSKVPKAEVLAVAAGCDIILMPLNARKAHSNIMERYVSDAEFKKTTDASIKRIIRMKLCLGLMNENS